MSTKIDSTKIAAAKSNIAKTKPSRKRPNPKIHIRETPKKDSATLCGGSHSPLWNLKGDRPLVSVSPQQAEKSTCGRCLRVARSPKRKVL